LANGLLEKRELRDTSSRIQLVIVEALTDDFRLPRVRDTAGVKISGGWQTFHFGNLSDDEEKGVQEIAAGWMMPPPAR
jgi:hypothetical protein